MHSRPYHARDATTLADIKARCDLADPLALFYRITSNTPDPQEKEEAKKWHAHVQSTKRSLCVEVYLPGVVCWVLVLDDDDADAPSEFLRNRRNRKKNKRKKDETVVGFTIWRRHGTSDIARRWRGEGEKLTTRCKKCIAHVNLSLRYYVDTSINRLRLAQLMEHLKTGPCPTPADKERWELEAMYIHPVYQRRGYGTQALEWGVQRALHESVRIWVWSTEAGKPLYLKNGFVEVGRVEFSSMIPGTATGVTVTVLAWGL